MTKEKENSHEQSKNHKQSGKLLSKHSKPWIRKKNNSKLEKRILDLTKT